MKPPKQDEKYTVKVVREWTPKSVSVVLSALPKPYRLEGALVSVEEQLKDRPTPKSVNRTGSGMQIQKTASVDRPDPSWGEPNSQSMGAPLGQLARRYVVNPFIRPGMESLQRSYSSADGLASSAIKTALLASIPVFAGSSILRTIRREPGVWRSAFRDSLLAGGAGAAVGAGINYFRDSPQARNLTKQSSFQQTNSLIQVINNSSQLSLGQKSTLRDWVNSAPPELLQRVMSIIGPVAGGGAALLLWNLFARQKGVMSNMAAVAAGAYMGHRMTRSPRSTTGQRILQNTDLYGRPRIL